MPTPFTWRDGPIEPGPAVIVDLDGTLADASGRQHFLDKRPKDWDRFFDACGEDPVVAHVARLVDCLDDELAVILLTARPSRVQPLTVSWLAQSAIRWDLLVMRADRDFSPSPKAKQEAVAALRGVGFDLRLAVDDDPRNVAMFEGEGIPCLYVHSGYY